MPGAGRCHLLSVIRTLALHIDFVDSNQAASGVECFMHSVSACFLGAGEEDEAISSSSFFPRFATKLNISRPRFLPERAKEKLSCSRTINEAGRGGRGRQSG